MGMPEQSQVPESHESDNNVNNTPNDPNNRQNATILHLMNEDRRVQTRNNPRSNDILNGIEILLGSSETNIDSIIFNDLENFFHPVTPQQGESPNNIKRLSNLRAW